MYSLRSVTRSGTGVRDERLTAPVDDSGGDQARPTPPPVLFQRTVFRGGGYGGGAWPVPAFPDTEVGAMIVSQRKESDPPCLMLILREFRRRAAQLVVLDEADYPDGQGPGDQRVVSAPLDGPGQRR